MVAELLKNVCSTVSLEIVANQDAPSGMHNNVLVCAFRIIHSRVGTNIHVECKHASLLSCT